MESPYSGERIDPGFTPKGLVEQHLATYRFVKPNVTGKIVLEIGFGEGYGSASLAENAKHVTSIDYDASAVSHARSRYGDVPNLEFLHMDATDMTLPDGKFELILSSQVIEHLHDQPAFLRRIRELLAPGGVAIVVTPNTHTSMENPYHIHEFEPEEYRQLLASIFPKSELYGVIGSERLMQAMEERRKWPKRLVKLDVFKLRERLPKDMVVAAYGLGARTVYKMLKKRGSGIEDEITQSDFTLRKDGLQGSLDLFGVGYSSEATPELDL